jgi:hypothetical protein
LLLSSLRKSLRRNKLVMTHNNMFMDVFGYQKTNYKPVGTKATFKFNESVFAKAVKRANQVTH